MSYLTNTFDDKVIKLLKSGGVGLLPTDTIYGLSALALDEQAVSRLDRIKSRSDKKPYVILISGLEQLKLFGLEMPKKLEHLWPGALTIIFETDKSPPWLHRETSTLAIRWPANKQLQALIDQTGPLISTSANRADETPAISAEQAKSIFGEELDFYVDSGELSGSPSTIVKLTDDKLQVIRAGVVKIQ